jgi:hypothetical protein
MDATEAQAVSNHLRWLFRLARPGGAPVSDERFYEAAFLVTRHARRALDTALGPEQIALPLGHLWKAASWRCRPSQPASLSLG